MVWAWTPSSRRSRPATAEWFPARAPRSHTQPSVSQGPDAAEVTGRARSGQRYALRMETVEPVFGQIKAGRGFRQFLLRGLEKVQGEWSMICTGHNLLKLFRSGLPADTRDRPSGIRKVLIFHWLPSIHQVSHPTTSPSIPSLSR